MIDRLRAYLENRMTLSDEQFDLIKDLLVARRIGKGEFLQHAGQVAQYGAFVAQGCLRSYVIDTKGKEHIVQFAPENWWLSDIESLAKGAPSKYFIDAIEDSEVILVDLQTHTSMMERIPGFASAFQSGIVRRAAAKDQRIVASISASAEQRYVDFLKTYPSIALRVPQHMIASYLGVSPETLSRVRKRLARTQERVRR